MPAHQLFLYAQRAAHAAHFVLEQHAQRLHDLQLHLFRQAANVVVALDLGGDAGDAGAFDHVGVNGALGQPAGALYGACIFVEGLYEQPADDLPFCLGLGNAGQRRQELRRRIGPYHVEAHVFIGGQHVLELVLSQ